MMMNLVQNPKIGTCPRSTSDHIYLPPLKIKVFVEIPVQSQMRECIVPSEDHTFTALISRIMESRYVSITLSNEAIF